MKLYILPVEKICKGKCKWCITKYRKTAKVNFLNINDLRDKLEVEKFDNIEITGGGDPTSHPDLDKIINSCAQHAPTHMYTHGDGISKFNSLNKLERLCVSIAHYDLEINRQIMGTFPELEFIKNLNIPVKFSLLVHKSGINNIEEMLKYFRWAEDFTNSIVVRQLFDEDYSGKMEGEFISTMNLFKTLEIRDYQLTKQRNPIFSIGNMHIEMEYRSCACEMSNPVLHADGKLYRGWTMEEL